MTAFDRITQEAGVLGGKACLRGMRVWVMDEGGYPSGFMGGRISRDFPDLRMQVLLPGDPPQPAFRTPPTRNVH